MRILRIRFVVTAACMAAVAACPASAAAAPPAVGGPLLDDGAAAAQPALITDRTPTFTIAGDPALECSLVPSGAAEEWTDCASGTFTPAAPLADGAFVFAARSRSATITETGEPRSFTVDATAPAVPRIEAPADGSLVTGSPQFAFAADAGTTLSCSLDGGAFAPCAAGPTFVFAADGAHALVLRAADAAGNVSPPSLPARFTVDVTAPTVRVTSPAEQGTTGRAVRVTYEASEPGVAYRCRIDLGRYVPCGAGSHVFRNLPPGVHRFRISATDRVGHQGPTTLRTFRVASNESEDPFAELDGASGAGASAGSGGPGLALLTMRARQHRQRLARHGLRIAVAPADGTTIVRIRILRRLGRRYRAVHAVVRKVPGVRRRVLVLRGRAIARLRAGRYRLEVTPGAGRRRLGAPIARPFVVLR